MMRSPSNFLRVPAMILALLGLCLSAGAASAQVPYDMSYQGRLTDAVGAPLIGPVNLQMRIYDVISGGTALYIEDHIGVAVDDVGAFSVKLGAGTAILGTFNSALFAGVNRYLEVVVDGEVLVPRLVMGSVPYAMQAESADSATSAATAVFALDANDAATLEGTTLSALIAMIPSSWSSGTGQLSTTDQVVIGTPAGTPTSQLHVVGDAVVEGSIVVGPGAVDLVAANTSLQGTVTTLQSLVSTLQADVASLTTQVGGVNDNTALLSQIDQMFLTTNSCPEGYSAVDSGYIKLGSPNLSLSQRTLSNPGHGHSHSLQAGTYDGHDGLTTMGNGAYGGGGLRIQGTTQFGTHTHSITGTVGSGSVSGDSAQDISGDLEHIVLRLCVQLPAARFHACADGLTVADNETGLLWERKTGAVDTGVDGVDCLAAACTDSNDVNNRYHWSASGSSANGNAYTAFLATLNSPPGFAGKEDWRLPELSELQSIVIGPAVSAYGNTNPTGQTATCSANPCVDPDFAAIGGETWPSNYWSATTDPVDASKAWHAAFFSAPAAFTDLKVSHMFARAVRTGSCTE